ncbi:MAG: dTDP-4-dehydrorhamnose 3,5-epimerase [Acidimicrobiia bacterium]
MHVVDTEIAEVKVITPKKFGDHRGFFSETYNKKALAGAGIDFDFVQDNHSHSAEQGTVRGLHYQIAPMAQDKLVRVAHGAILDIAVDLRKGSPTFGQHVSEVISAENWKQVLVPIGFAHGYVTLEPDTEVLYKTTDFYSPEHDRGIIWSDPDLGIDWGIEEGQAVLSEKDRALPPLSQVTDFFEYRP